VTPQDPPAAPLLVRLAGRRVVGVGGGEVAARKLVPLAREHGADVHVIAPTVHDELAAVATCSLRPYEGPVDLAGAMLVVAATAAPEVNARVERDAEQAGVWCVRVDRGGTGSAAFPATVRRGQLTLSVATGGGAPVLARWLRAQLAQTYGPEYGALAALLAELRRDPRVQAAMAPLDDAHRARLWRSVPLPDILELLRSGSVETAKEVAAACLFSRSD
jgi:precorrin-2 dehydrogenase / sirohydrochlorin ferrochelatase